MSHRLGRTPVSLEHALRSTFGNDGSTATRVDILRNGDEIFPSMLAAIDQARQTIEFGTFVYWQGDIARSFASLLADRARQGVAVRVLIDAYGGKKMDDHLKTLMVDAGCQVETYNPLNWRRPWRAGHRTHRKTLVVDNACAFTGGVGIASEWEGDANDPSEWRDTHVRFEGPVVTDLRATFIESWLDTTGAHPVALLPPEPDSKVVPGSVDGSDDLDERFGSRTFVVAADHADGHNDIHDHFRLLVGMAQTKLNITTAYFVPDPAIVADLEAAAARGVRVRLLLPGPHTDKNFVRVATRSLMQDLAGHGIEVWTYQRTMLHAKVVTVDGVVASVGSANINRRSSHHDKEANVVVFDEGVATVLDGHFDDDLVHAVPLAEDDVSNLGGWRSTVEDALRPLRPWM